MTDTHQQVVRSDIPFRIRIGVTGHRQLPDEKALSEKVQQVLGGLTEVIKSIQNGKKLKNTNHPLEKDIYDLFDKASRKAIRSSSHTPIVFSIMTPIAEGADRLVAKEVLKIPDSTIEVVLPLVKEDYLQDFKSTKSKKEFNTLLRHKQGRRPITLRKQRLEEEFTKGNLKEARRKAYEDVGRYVVNHCDVLIALWDGQESRGKGGTAEIVNYAKEKCPVIIISTISPYGISVVKGGVLNAKSISRVEMFNEFHITESEQQGYIKNVYDELFNDPENPDGMKLPENSKNLVREKLIPFYTRASEISKYNQNIYRYSGTLIYAFSAAAVAAVNLGALISGLSPYLYFLEFVFLATIVFLVIFANWRNTHKKWIESRFLTERIRTAIFFASCEVEASPVEVPPHMLPAHRHNDWMVKVFDEIWNRLPVFKGCHGGQCQQYGEFIQKQWIQDQINYHRKKSAKSEKISKILEWSGMAIFSVAMIIAISHLILPHSSHVLQSTNFNNLLTFFAIVLPAVGAAIGGIRIHREYSRLEKRSRNMVAVLTDLNERYPNINKPDTLESLLREAEELMLRETQDWLMLMKFVQLKPPA